jgi:DUF1009 family protein
MTEQYGVALLCGGGKLPINVAEACIADGIKPLIITFKGQPQPDLSNLKLDTMECGLGQVGKVLQTLKDNGIKRICMAGHLSKPSLFDIKFDITGLKLMSKLRSKHDDALLRAVCELFEQNGIAISAAHELCPALLAPVGMITPNALTEEQMTDVSIGLKAVTTLGALDIGQAAIIKDGVVIGVEGVEGTKALIERCASLRGASGKGGILVKVAKPKQTLKVDMPTVGVETVFSLGDYNYDGMAILGNKTLMLDKDQMIIQAAERGLFIYGMSEDA